jgi:hypothetical protein
MSKLGELFALAQRVSIAAKEEASRYDLPQIDLDHLLLALLISGGPAGVLLREQGATLDATRTATEQVRARHIARLGVVPPPADPRPIRDPSLGDIDWTPRAIQVVSNTSEPGELDLLQALLDEPSGLVTEVLAEAGVDPVALRAALAERRRVAGTADSTGTPDQDWLAVTHTGFAPAPVGAVWALVSDPARRPEWDTTVGGVRPTEPDVWEMTLATTRPDGRPVRHRPEHVRAHHRLTAYEPEELVEWEVTLPDQRGTRPARQRLRVHCRPAAEGTTLELTLSWPRRTGWRRLRQTLLGPASRALATMTLINYATSISRALR